jgi:hypothetical protein
LKKELNPSSNNASSRGRKKKTNAESDTQRTSNKKRAKVKDEGSRVSPVIICENEELQVVKVTRASSKSEYNDVQVVEALTAPMIPVAQKPAADSNDDVVVVGATNQVRLPHMRQHCTEMQFDSAPNNGLGFYSATTLATNSKACDLCYCYVCDCPVKDCNQWLPQGTTRGSMRDTHCCASDKSTQWTRLRSTCKHNKATGKPNSNELGESFGNRSSNGFSPENEITARAAYVRQALRGQPGPFAPEDNTDAGLDETLTKCRKCGWYSRIQRHTSQPSRKNYCHQCGRVASERDFDKEQASQHKPQATDCYLGKKVIPFRILARDPRSLDGYRRNWERADTTSQEWTYNEVEMEADAFRHRLGTHPRIDLVLKRIIYLSDEKKTKNNKDDDFITVEKESYIFLFKLISRFEGWIVKSSLVAEWDQTTRSGVSVVDSHKWTNDQSTKFSPKLFRLLQKFIIQLSLSDQKLNLKYYQSEDFNYFLGMWFDVYPTTFQGLDHDLRMRAQPSSLLDTLMQCPRISASLATQKSLKTKLHKWAKTYSIERKSARDKLSLVCSSGSRSMGCTSSNDVSFAGVLKGYHMHFLPKYILLFSSDRSRVIARFRAERTDCSDCHDLTLLLGSERSAFASCLQGEARKLLYRNCSIHEVMMRLENIGHAKVDFVEGLNVELLDFQRQSLQWALEREKLPDGIQSYFWAKLPADPDRKDDLYYNPIIQKFRNDKPRVVRGGFIAEEMGLGKTVISLALILKNPAPLLPESGKPVSDLWCESGADATAHEGWNQDLHKTATISSAKRGSILTRGTLVIVSLGVTQNHSPFFINALVCAVRLTFLMLRLLD